MHYMNDETRNLLENNKFWWQMRIMLGRRVRVTLSKEPRTELVGTLLAFDEGGEVIVQDDCGFRRFGWPNLDCIVTEDVPMTKEKTFNTQFHSLDGGRLVIEPANTDVVMHIGIGKTCETLTFTKSDAIEAAHRLLGVAQEIE